MLTCRRWEVSWDVLSGGVLAIAARGRGRSWAGQSRRSNVRSVLQLGCGLVGKYNHWQRSSADLPYMGMGPGKIEQKR